MFKNYLKTAIRNLLKFRGYSLINIFGLSVGIACCILIMLFVRNEVSYDSFHENKDRIYRAYCTIELSGGRKLTSPNLPIPFGPTVSADFPEVENVVRFQERTGVVRYRENLVRQELLFSDPAILKVFTFPLILGEPKTAMSSPNSIVISREMAEKYFANEEPLGEQLSIRLNEEELTFFVSGVVENVPENSSLKFDFLVPFERLFKLSEGASEREKSWDSFSTVTFLQLNQSSQLNELMTKFPTLIKQHFNDPLQIFLQPLTDIHLDPHVGSGGLEPVSDPKYSYILAGISVIVLLIACVNFMTLTLGHSASRGVEVGMRKVLGAQRIQIIKQFWGEAFFMSTLALIFGVAIAEFFLPTFNLLTEKNLSLDLTSDIFVILSLFSLALIAGLVAGSYPAFLLSKYQTVEAFKGKFKLGSTSVFGKILVVFQFSLSIFLIICTILMTHQKNYLMKTNLGYNDEQVIVIPTIRSSEGEGLLANLRNEITHLPDIVSISGASFSFDRGSHRVSTSFDEQNVRAYEYRVDYDYLSTLEIDLIRGRNFSKEFQTDPTEAAIVNEALVAEFGWKEPLGKIFMFRGRRLLKVIGIVKNYHFESLHRQIAPAVLHLDPNTPLRYLLVKIQPHDIPGTLATLKSKWRELASDLPFEAYFLDNDVARQYRAEQRWGKIVSYASGFAIFIACMGLFGLASLNVTRRTKEIGIRKVLGASVSGLAGLVSKEFLVLVLLGNVVAWPIAYFTMNSWLENFAYRIEVGMSSFLLATTAAIFIAALTVSYQAIKAALTNPVEALRYE